MAKLDKPRRVGYVRRHRADALAKGLRWAIDQIGDVGAMSVADRTRYYAAKEALSRYENRMRELDQ